MPLLAALLVAAPAVILVDNTSLKTGVPVGFATLLDPSLCTAFETAGKAVGIEVKCKADVEAILKLRAMQTAITGSQRCTASVRDCAAQTAKLVSATHVVLASVKRRGAEFVVEVVLVDSYAKPLATVERVIPSVKTLLPELPSLATQFLRGLK
jgi:phenylalanyl-tRNA synthetase beta subunit